MFSTQQKRDIANKVQSILRETNHPELPTGEINFSLHVDGAESWSWADIRNNGSVDLIRKAEANRQSVPTEVRWD